MARLEIEQFKELYAIAQTMDDKGTDIADRFASTILLQLATSGEAHYDIKELAKELMLLNSQVTYVDAGAGVFHKNFQALKEYIR